MKYFPSFTLVCVLLVFGPMIGCASSGNDRRSAANQTVEQVQNLSEAITESRQQVQDTLAAVEALPGSGTKLKRAYDQLDEELSELHGSAQRVAERRAAMKQQFAVYQQLWYSRTVEIDNPTLRDAAEQRIAEVRADFDAIEPAYREVREAYRPYLDHLDEVRTYLASDLTTPAVEAMVPTIEQARQSAGSLRTAMDQLLIKLQALTDSLIPSTSGRVDGPAA